MYVTIHYISTLFFTNNNDHQCPSEEDHLLFTYIGHGIRQCSLKRAFKFIQLSAFSEADSHRIFSNFLCMTIIHPKKNFIKMWKKNRIFLIFFVNYAIPCNANSMSFLITNNHLIRQLRCFLFY